MRVVLLVGLVGVVLQLQACDEFAAFPSFADAAAAPQGWTVIPAGTANLNAVSGLSDSAVWVVGDRGTIGYWNGNQLVFEKSGTTANLRGVWAVDANHVYAVGDGGTILERQADLWQQVGAKATQQLLTAVWADTSGRVVAVGSSGTIVLGTTAGVYTVLTNIDPNTTLPYAENLFGVTGTLGGPVVVVGALGLMVQINAGGTITSSAAIQPTFAKLLSGAATGPNGAFFVGQQGQVFSSTAAGVTSISGCPQTALRAVSAAGPGPDVWAAGWDGTICKISGTTGRSFPYTDARWFNGIYAASPTSLWVVGASGTLLHGLPIPPLTDAGTMGTGLEGG